jgi:hypothetical protein
MNITVRHDAEVICAERIERVTSVIARKNFNFVRNSVCIPWKETLTKKNYGMPVMTKFQSI